jgi:hypothetical protein
LQEGTVLQHPSKLSLRHLLSLLPPSPQHPTSLATATCVTASSLVLTLRHLLALLHPSPQHPTSLTPATYLTAKQHPSLPNVSSLMLTLRDQLSPLHVSPLHPPPLATPTCVTAKQHPSLPRLSQPHFSPLSSAQSLAYLATTPYIPHCHCNIPHCQRSHLLC